METPAHKKNSKIQKVFHSFDVTNPFQLREYEEMGPYSPPGDMHISPQILLILRGSMEMYYRNFKVVCRPGDFCLTGPWEPHRAILLPGKVRYMVVTLDLGLIGSVSAFHDVDWIYPFLLPPEEHPHFNTRRERAMILRTARYLHQIEIQKIPGFRSYQWLEIHRLLWHIQARVSNRKASFGALQKIYPAIVLARNEVMRLIPLDEAAELCGLSRSRFSDLFKQETGCSFGGFALQIRINAAAVALTESHQTASIKQVAADFGFSDVSHFYRSFHRVLGCTPLEFIEKQKTHSSDFV